MFLREEQEEDYSYSLFSVELGKGGPRAIVTYDGPDDGSGKWSCGRDSGMCGHIREAQQALPKLVSGDPNATRVFEETIKRCKS